MDRLIESIDGRQAAGFRGAIENRFGAGSGEEGDRIAPAMRRVVERRGSGNRLRRGTDALSKCGDLFPRIAGAVSYRRRRRRRCRDRRRLWRSCGSCRLRLATRFCRLRRRALRGGTLSRTLLGGRRHARIFLRCSRLCCSRLRRSRGSGCSRLRRGRPVSASLGRRRLRSGRECRRDGGRHGQFDRCCPDGLRRGGRGRLPRPRHGLSNRLHRLRWSPARHAQERNGARQVLEPHAPFAEFPDHGPLHAPAAAGSTRPLRCPDGDEGGELVEFHHLVAIAGGGHIGGAGEPLLERRREKRPLRGNARSRILEHVVRADHPVRPVRLAQRRRQIAVELTRHRVAQHPEPGIPPQISHVERRHRRVVGRAAHGFDDVAA